MTTKAPTLPACPVHPPPCPGGCEIEDADGPDTRAPYPGVPVVIVYADGRRVEEIPDPFEPSRADPFELLDAWTDETPP